MLRRVLLALALMWSFAAHATAQECDDDGGAPEDDGVACTIDLCARASTAHVPDNALCDDGLPCTSDLCTLSGCENTAISACVADAGVEAPDAQVDAASGDGDAAPGDGDGDNDASTTEADAAVHRPDGGDGVARDAALSEHDAASEHDGGSLAQSGDDGCSCRVGPGTAESREHAGGLGCALVLLAVLSTRRSRRRLAVRFR